MQYRSRILRLEMAQEKEKQHKPMIITGITPRNLFVTEAEHENMLFSAEQLRCWNAPLIFNSTSLYEVFCDLCNGNHDEVCAIIDDVCIESEENTK